MFQRASCAELSEFNERWPQNLFRLAVFVSQIWAAQFGSVLYVVPTQFIVKVDMARFSQNFRLKV